jgi:diphthine synthase
VLYAAENEHVAFLTAGDTMISTTHVDLRLRAADRGIETRVIAGPTAQSAASGLAGLQNYRFGKATTLPFVESHGGDGVPGSVLDAIRDNRDRGLHTVVYLDIKAEEGRYMTGDVAAEMLAADYEDVLGVVIARAGSPNPVVAADVLSELATRDFGDPLHLLVIPGTLHLLEAEALEAFAGAPEDLLDVE